MRTAAETQVRRPSAVRALTVLLAVTAAATVVVELLNWWYAPEQGFGLAVRTGWAMLRSLGFLLLIRWARRLLVAITLGVLAVDLPLCGWLLGVDGLVRDGGPLLAAAALALYGLWRAGRAEGPIPAG
ncbi:hypothetical protein ABGB16_00515 [Micromonospora sp. B11E3]|uniref:hypothetical protein n=1 Tax=Micromonospora sp. B11E3 TaxID=3153562 RepID=UPI00325E28EC